MGWRGCPENRDWGTEICKDLMTERSASVRERESDPLELEGREIDRMLQDEVDDTKVGLTQAHSKPH